jgi:hypothetical protein
MRRAIIDPNELQNLTGLAQSFGQPDDSIRWPRTSAAN